MASHKTNFLCNLFVMNLMHSLSASPKRVLKRLMCGLCKQCIFKFLCFLSWQGIFFQLSESPQWLASQLGWKTRLLVLIENWTLKCAFLNIHQSASNHFQSFSIIRHPVEKYLVCHRKERKTILLTEIITEYIAGIAFQNF